MVSFRTANIIQNNRKYILCDAGGSDKNGMYVGWVEIDPNVAGRWTPLFNTEAIYKSKVEAVTAMKNLVEVIANIDLFAKLITAPARDCRF